MTAAATPLPRYLQIEPVGQRKLRCRTGVDAVWNNAAYRAFRDCLDSDDPAEVCRGCAVYAGTFRGGR